jgi:translation elongation factor EF-1beta
MPQVIAAKATQLPAAEEEKKEEEDGFDMDWGDDEDEESAPAASENKTMSRAERVKAAKEAKTKKNVGRTQVILEIKPIEVETDLNQLWRDVCALSINGVTWGEGFEIVPVAFGICKLVMSCVMIDDEVGMDDITEAIESGFEDFVQSVDVAAMNKV